MLVALYALHPGQPGRPLRPVGRSIPVVRAKWTEYRLSFSILLHSRSLPFPPAIHTSHPTHHLLRRASRRQVDRLDRVAASAAPHLTSFPLSTTAAVRFAPSRTWDWCVSFDHGIGNSLIGRHWLFTITNYRSLLPAVYGITPGWKDGGELGCGYGIGGGNRAVLARSENSSTSCVTKIGS